MTTVVVRVKNKLPPNTRNGLKVQDEIWAAYRTESKRRDEKMLKAYDDNMNSLLTFVGHFPYYVSVANTLCITRPVYFLVS